MASPLLSIVVPVYRAERMIEELLRRLCSTLSQISKEFEIILVNDSSPDNSWFEIVKHCHLDSRIKGINLSRNFGQHSAISAGLQCVTGDWIVVMDCDLQDQPEEIIELYNAALSGYEIVYARRVDRKDSVLKRMSSSVFHKVFNWLSGINSDKTVANFGIYKKCVIQEFNKMQESVRFFPSLIQYLGFSSTSIDVAHSERAEGKSSYDFTKRLKLGLDVIISNSNKPLSFAVGLGFSMSFLSFVLALYNILAKCFGIIQVPGYTTTVFSIWFVGGVLLFVMGLLGVYIGRIFNQVKGRQLFIIKEKVNF